MVTTEADLIAARKHLQDKINDCLPDHDKEACERLNFAIDRLITIHISLLSQRLVEVISRL